MVVDRDVILASHLGGRVGRSGGLGEFTEPFRATCHLVAMGILAVKATLVAFLLGAL